MSESSFYTRHRVFRHLLGHPKLLLCTILAVAIYLLQPSDWRAATRVLIAWNFGTFLYFGWTLWGMSRATEASMRRQAMITDESRHVVLVLAMLAALASLSAIVAQLAAVKDMSGAEKTAHITLAFGTILTSWAFVHLLFAQHYAHEFFVERRGEMELPDESQGGLIFPGDQRVTFWDFLYFSYVIGVANQTADVAISSRPMRRLALIHCVIAFFFNTTVLALTINIAAGLI